MTHLPPTLFVHGVPDTGRLWDKVRAHLAPARRGRALDLPGFGSPLPAGFSATMDAYADWLIHEVEAFGTPVHLVGHDWGGLLVMRVASLRPERVASWTAGGVVIDPDYVWHEMAQAWQTPGVGEEIMAVTDAAAMAQALIDAESPAPDAHQAAALADDVMKAAVLSLYRSAQTIGADWSPALAGLSAHGLVIFGARDPYCDWRLGQVQALRAGAEFELFEDCGHWWPLQRPSETAAALERLWSGVESHRSLNH